MQYNIKSKNFLKEMEYEAKNIGEEIIKNSYLKQHKLKVIQENGKTKEEKIKVHFLEDWTMIKKEQDEQYNFIVTYRCVYNLLFKPIGKNYKTIEENQDVYVTVYETQLSEERYNRLIRDYCKILFKFDSAQEYPDLTGQITKIIKSKVSYKALYFGLKYYYDFLKKPIPHKIEDIQDCKNYCYQGLGYYISGEQWREFFNKKCCGLLQVTKNEIQEKLAKEYFSLFEEYQYSFEDIITGLTYYYKILEKPIPDKPNLIFLSSVMQNAKNHIVEYNERQVLLNYIYKLFNLDEGENYPLIQAEIRKYHSIEYGKLTYKGMLSTLDYYYNIMGNPLPQIPNVGIIPYQYNNALNFYKQRKAVKDNGDLPDKVPVVRITISREARLKSQQLYEDRYKWKPTKLISEIEVDEDETFDRL